MQSSAMGIIAVLFLVSASYGHSVKRRNPGAYGGYGGPVVNKGHGGYGGHKGQGGYVSHGGGYGGGYGGYGSVDYMVGDPLYVAEPAGAAVAVEPAVVAQPVGVVDNSFGCVC